MLHKCHLWQIPYLMLQEMGVVKGTPGGGGERVVVPGGQLGYLTGPLMIYKAVQAI